MSMLKLIACHFFLYKVYDISIYVMLCYGMVESIAPKITQVLERPAA